MNVNCPFVGAGGEALELEQGSRNDLGETPNSGYLQRPTCSQNEILTVVELLRSLS